jgi:hypothetical protein
VAGKEEGGSKRRKKGTVCSVGRRRIKDKEKPRTDQKKKIGKLVERAADEGASKFFAREKLDN